MFEDESRPLYKLCWKIELKRIEKGHYQQHIQAAANIAWREKLGDDFFEKIFTLTEFHPYYVNKFCDRLFAYFPTNLPPLKELDAIWDNILQEEKDIIEWDEQNQYSVVNPVIKYYASKGAL